MAGYIGSKASVVSSGAERKKTFAITTSTTSLIGLAYTVNQVHVFHNGIRLVDGTDYTATDGTTITLTNAAANGDEVVVVSYAAFQTSDTYTKAQADAEFVQVAGDTMTGNLTTSGTVTATSFAGDGSALTGVGASTTAGDVGTYAWLWRDNAGTTLGSTHAGSTLFYAVQNDDNTTGAIANSYKGNGIVRSSISPSGTWRAMGSNGTYSTTHGQATLYVRIS